MQVLYTVQTLHMTNLNPYTHIVLLSIRNAKGYHEEGLKVNLHTQCDACWSVAIIQLVGCMIETDVLPASTLYHQELLRQNAL